MVLCLLSFQVTLAQQSSQCILHITGTISDRDSKLPLPSATVLVDRVPVITGQGQQNLFSTGSLCRGHHTILVRYIGYDSLEQEIYLTRDTVIHFALTRSADSLHTVTVVADFVNKGPIATLAASNLRGQALFQTRGATLGESLKSITGLNSIQTGPSISKPVIHGLHSNRVLILNNGIRQEGQQWGSEHAPEIDPFIASRITIIKGAASVRYGSDALSGVILLEPKDLQPTKRLAGEYNLVAGSNGRLGASSAMLEGSIKDSGSLSWRVQGTLKRAGNFRTAHYYLKNTGLFEGDFSAALAYHKAAYGVDLYYSEFHNKVGIFDGSHVGNINDLYAAFARTTPITPSYFSYKIDRTYQYIVHTLFKASAYYKFQNGNKLEAVFATQRNKRDEYDIDLPYSTDPAVLSRPQISFEIRTPSLEFVYTLAEKNHFSGSLGLSGTTQGNVFRGIRYLVPNFRNYNGGAFAIEKYSKDKLTLEAGIRYDYRWLRVYKLNNTTLETYHNTTDYKNLTGTFGISYAFSPAFSFSANIGTAWRAPSVNELYIDGIHLSAASYERGDSSLQSERSYNLTVSAKYTDQKLSAELVLYNNRINNYIYAKPTLQPIQLISGTYPYFVYTQVNANLKGFDLDISYKPFNRITILSKTSVVRGWNRAIHDYLVFMPADRLDNSIQYQLPDLGRLKEAYIGLQNISVFRQSRVPPNSDYVPPPPGYSLFNINVGCNTELWKDALNLNLSVDNVTNVAYRDYLNRFRYYCDDLGINIILRAKLSF